jgi:hypothetical protein
LPLGIVVDITVYSLVLPSSVFGVVHEERSIDFYCELLLLFVLLFFAANYCQPVRAEGEIKISSGAEGFVDEEDISSKTREPDR